MLKEFCIVQLFPIFRVEFFKTSIKALPHILPDPLKSIRSPVFSGKVAPPSKIMFSKFTVIPSPIISNIETKSPSSLSTLVLFKVLVPLPILFIVTDLSIAICAVFILPALANWFICSQGMSISFSISIVPSSPFIAACSSAKVLTCTAATALEVSLLITLKNVLKIKVNAITIIKKTEAIYLTFFFTTIHLHKLEILVIETKVYELYHIFLLMSTYLC